MASRPFMRVFRTAIIVCVVASCIHYLINNKNYTIAVREVKRWAEKYSGQHPTQAMPKLMSDIRRAYPKHVIPADDPNWFTLGGLRVKFYIIHASLTEYLALIGSPGRTSGHAGFHWMNQSCSVLNGNVQRWKDGAQLTRENFRPGDHVRFAMFEGAVVDLSEDTWLLCYGRGFVPASVPYLAMNFLAQSVDPLTPLQMLYTGGRSIAREVLYSFQSLYAHYSAKIFGK